MYIAFLTSISWITARAWARCLPPPPPLLANDLLFGFSSFFSLPPFSYWPWILQTSVRLSSSFPFQVHLDQILPACFWQKAVQCAGNLLRTWEISVLLITLYLRRPLDKLLGPNTRNEDSNPSHTPVDMQTVKTFKDSCLPKLSLDFFTQRGAHGQLVGTSRSR